MFLVVLRVRFCPGGLQAGQAPVEDEEGSEAEEAAGPQQLPHAGRPGQGTHCVLCAVPGRLDCTTSYQPGTAGHSSALARTNAQLTIQLT